MVYIADNLKILFVFSIEKQIIGNEIDESKITKYLLIKVDFL